jgi:hypothetical protein
MKQELKKLDRRFNGYGHWTHRTEPQGFRNAVDWRINFLDFRNWMWGTYGPGCKESEASALVAIGREVPVWGWDDYGSIYARDTAMTSLLLAKDRFIKRHSKED